MGMFARVRSYFKDAKLARMSNGALYLVRDLGPVKGGKGMKHHEMIMPLSIRAAVAFVRSARARASWSELPQDFETNSPNAL